MSLAVFCLQIVHVSKLYEGVWFDVDITIKLNAYNFKQFYNKLLTMQNMTELELIRQESDAPTLILFMFLMIIFTIGGAIMD